MCTYVGYSCVQTRAPPTYFLRGVALRTPLKEGTAPLPVVIEGRLVIVIFLGWSIGARENGPPCIGNCKVIIHFDGHFCYRLVTCGMTFRLAGALPWAIPGRCLLLDLFFGFVEHW